MATHGERNESCVWLRRGDEGVRAVIFSKKLQEPVMASEHWEHFRHEADIGVRGFGPTKEAAFAQAALATTAVIAEPASVKAHESVSVACAASDDELLLADWLNALVHEIAVRKMLFSRFEVQIKDHHLTAKMWGEKVDVARHEPAVEIKGATYTELRVQHDNGWIAQCVVDV
jgi:tRNA nucleotidyltransferase (CCA-adding enzyme)